MWYIVQAKFENITLDLFDINIPKEEMLNVLDAFNCERWYNKLDLSIPGGKEE